MSITRIWIAGREKSEKKNLNEKKRKEKEKITKQLFIRLDCLLPFIPYTRLALERVPHDTGWYFGVENVVNDDIITIHIQHRHTRTHTHR